MTDAWRAFRDFVARTEDLPVGFLVKGACARDPGEAETRTRRRFPMLPPRPGPARFR
jgi:hypothetical protein